MEIEVTQTQRGEQPLTAVSEQVRDFYDRMPYPAPLTSLDEHRELYGYSDRRRALFHRMWPTGRPRPNLEILVAGCGTSQAAKYALREPDAQITAVDISEVSLHHTRELKKKYHLNNLDLHKVSIFDVQTLGQTFDQIVCTGVLHHLPDPDLGLRALRDVLRPQGAMQIMVYARYGRAGIYMMQEYCRLLGVGTSTNDLRNLRATLEVLSADHPLFALLHKARDFQQPEALADALLHPLDRAYTVPELYRWLEKCGLSFGRWTEQAPYLAKCGAVAWSPHAARLASLPLPIQHAAVELLRGTIVSHSFITYRDDRSGESQPITFSGKRWRNYVPIALPWSVSVRENVPPGSAAVLINRTHRFTDLILSVDSFENRLLNTIDGKRTLGEIVESAGQDNGVERRALSFFERLWQYDHVVFDASRAV